MSPIYARISELLNKKNVSGFKMCKEIGIQPSILSDLKTGRQTSMSFSKAQKIASYLGVTADYILYGTAGGKTGLYQTIENLCAAKGVSITEMCRDSGAPRGSLTDLKMGRIVSLHPDSVQKIADYFGVSMDTIYGREETKEEDLLPIHILARNGKNLSVADQELLLKYAKFMFPEAFK